MVLADKKWYWAEAKIEGNSVVVESPQVAEPVAVRYAWQSNPVATLQNGAGLPAVPFRTDDWPEMTQAVRPY
jgi:sialate O-acetylesterase